MIDVYLWIEILILIVCKKNLYLNDFNFFCKEKILIKMMFVNLKLLIEFNLYV